MIEFNTDIHTIGFIHSTGTIDSINVLFHRRIRMPPEGEYFDEKRNRKRRKYGRRQLFPQQTTFFAIRLELPMNKVDKSANNLTFRIPRQSCE